MSLFALLCVLTGSLLHVGWNVLGKRASDRIAFFWLTLLPTALVGVILLLLDLASPAPQVGPVGWMCMIISGAIHGAYFYFLALAYGSANLSFVYPYTRGIGTGFAVLGGLVFLGERPSSLGWTGVALTLSASLLEPGLSQWRARRAKPAVRNAGATGPATQERWRGILFTVLSGLMIATYLVVDKVGVSDAPVATYLFGFLIGPVFALAPAALSNRRFRKEWKLAPWRPVWAALWLCSAYFVILYAMKLAPVTYVVSARATGIVVSAIAGAALFSERIEPTRWVAIAIICAGVVCIGLA